MIPHALTILLNELEKHLGVYGNASGAKVEMGNVAEGFKTGSGPGISRDVLNLTVVNIREERALKNLPHYVRNEAKLKVTFENQPVFLNFLLLMTATHGNYQNAMLALSRAVRFFQFNNVLTQENVEPASITTNQPLNLLDRLEEFKFIFELHSPTLEEINHLWGTLGGKQYPFVLYWMRMLELKFHSIQGESGLITEVMAGFSQREVPAL